MSNANLVGEHPTKNPWKDGLGRTSIRASQILLIVTLLSVSIFALTKVTLVVIPFLLALILAAAISPVVKWLINKGMPALLATTLSFVVLIVTFVGVLTGIVFAVKNEWAGLVQHATEGFNKLYAYAQDGPFPIDDKLISDTKNTAVGFLTSSTFGSGALSGISAATSFFAGLVLMVVILFFLLKDGSHMWKFFLGFLPDARRAKASLAGKRTMEILGGYVRGTATVAAVDAIAIGVALAVLHVPLALPLAVLTFIGAFIPLVGATAAGAFAVLIALVSNDPWTALIVLIVVIVVNQVEGNFLQPVVMGNVLSVHGLVILLALTVGTVLAGIVGAILSVPIAAVLWGVIKVWKDYVPSDSDDEAPAGIETSTIQPVEENSEETTPCEVTETIIEEGNGIQEVSSVLPEDVPNEDTVISDNTVTVESDNALFEVEPLVPAITPIATAPVVTESDGGSDLVESIASDEPSNKPVDDVTDDNVNTASQVDGVVPVKNDDDDPKDSEKEL